MPRTRVNPQDGAVLIWIPGGEFTMGGLEFSSERPPHRYPAALEEILHKSIAAGLSLHPR